VTDFSLQPKHLSSYNFRIYSITDKKEVKQRKSYCNMKMPPFLTYFQGDDIIILYQL